MSKAAAFENNQQRRGDALSQNDKGLLFTYRLGMIYGLKHVNLRLRKPQIFPQSQLLKKKIFMTL